MSPNHLQVLLSIHLKHTHTHTHRHKIPCCLPLCVWVCVCVLGQVWLFTTPRRYPNRLFCARNSPGRNIRVGSHSLLQGLFPPQASDPAMSLLSPILAGGFFTTSTTWEALISVLKIPCLCLASSRQTNNLWWMLNLLFSQIHFRIYCFSFGLLQWLVAGLPTLSQLL